jgi:hypothetical protein
MKTNRLQVNRRAFLRGAGGVAIGLPFLESLPERSAWAQDAQPIFSFFLMMQNGVIQSKFWPTEVGALSAATLSGTSLEPLSDYAANLLVLKGINHAQIVLVNSAHTSGCVQSFTALGVSPDAAASSPKASGPSADCVIAQGLNPAGIEGLNLYAGSQHAFINEALSFASTSAEPRGAELNPYRTFERLVGVSSTEGGAPGSGGSADPAVIEALLLRKKSMNDLVLAEFNYLLNLPELSSFDRQKLEHHMSAIRQLEMNLMSTGGTMNEMNDGTGEFYGCNISPSTMTALDAYRDGITFNTNSHMIEDLVALHAETVALTFACGANVTAALQWGSGTDGTVYTTVAQGAYNTFHKISHQTNSDSASGTDAFAAAAHAEIDLIRMNTFAKVLESFKNYGLFDKSIILCVNSVNDGRAHGFTDIPVVCAGTAGGYFKNGEYIDFGAEGRTNAQLLASIIDASGIPTTNFGAGGGLLTDIRA